jgi:hypothetical protein
MLCVRGNLLSCGFALVVRLILIKGSFLTVYAARLNLRHPFSVYGSQILPTTRGDLFTKCSKLFIVKSGVPPVELFRAKSGKSAD